MLIRFNIVLCFLILYLLTVVQCLITDFPPERIKKYREKVRSMFYHAYNGYLNHAYPLDELKPLSCTGMNTWGSFSLTLVDALDTLLIMGNETEFRRAVDLVLTSADADANVNVSVFETNIRVVGDMELHSGWPCAGPLLDLAEKFAQKLLPAFNTETGMPYGTVNLRYGVNRHETPITCTAGVGTFVIEFGALSRLTGNPIYDKVATRAMNALWAAKSAIGLVGNHINVQTGEWTATDAGIGAGVDSYFEYLAKAALLFQKPVFMHQFRSYLDDINKYVRKEEWFMWVSMTKGQVNFPIFQSLEAFWPGLLALTGQVEDAAKIMLNYDQVNRQYGAPPEFYNLPNREAVAKRAGYPLRPEIVESMMYLYKGTDDPHYLHMAANIVEMIEATSKTSCGYATIQDMTKRTLEDRMESFFLSETTKYLYLIFDPDNFIHNDGSMARIVNHPAGECVIHGGGWIFNTEAHPVDPASLYCCSSQRHHDEVILRTYKENIDFVTLLDLDEPIASGLQGQLDEHQLHQDIRDLKSKDDDSEDVDRDLQELTRQFDKVKARENSVLPSVNEERVDSNSEPNEDNDVDEIQRVTSTSAFIPGSQALHPKKQRTRRRRGLSKRDKNDVIKMPNNVKTEADEKKKVKQQIADLILALDKLDKAAGKNASESANLLQLLGTLGSEYSSLLKASTKLQKLAAIGGDVFSKLKQDLIKNKVKILSPINEAFCEDCCVPLDAEYDSLALRSMLNVIYSNHLYTRCNIPFLPGPICRKSDEQNPANAYNSEPPDTSQMEMDEEPYFSESLRFGTFAFRQLTLEHHRLLTTKPRPFSSYLMGMGQVIDTLKT